MVDVAIWQDREARRAFIARGQRVFKEIEEKLEGATGVVAIEPETGYYFVGETLGKANAAAFEQFPDRWLYFVRLDDPEAAMPLPTW